MRILNILVVCTGNTCRSVLAEYLGRKFCAGVLTFESAGINPQTATAAENAVYLLHHTFGIDASAHQPRDVRSLDLEGFDLVIAIEKNAAVVVRQLGVAESKLRIWPVRDPWGGNLAEYEKAALDIRRRLDHLKRSVASEGLGGAP
jgi:protein-tyrosine-phosphatase